ncbi:MAG TPA: hypothetical protein VM890_08705 [Longimicrobium sp.]|jgi:hypothetical protein|nr:hypothetical protein [Longimicrobium sp.]
MMRDSSMMLRPREGRMMLNPRMMRGDACIAHLSPVVTAADF